jgi:hypothetical protein
MRSTRSRRLTVALLVTLMTLLTLPVDGALGARPKPRGGAAVEDPERNSQVVTPWGWHYNVEPATATNFINQGYRIIDLEVTSSSPRFTLAYVRDQGVYDRTWWWYYGLTASGVSTRLSNNNARLIDIEPYYVGGALRFAVVMVRNTGEANKAWWWYYGQTVAGISTQASNHNARPIDIDRYSTGSGDRFAVIMIRNTGVDQKGWWHYYNVSPAFISSHLSGRRLIDLERLGNGNFDVIMQTAGGQGWWWYYGQTAGQVNARASQLGARIYKIEQYGDRFAMLLINNVNAETARIRNLIGNDLSKGAWGFFVKRAGGGEVIGLQPDLIFEPASAIKATHAVHALRAVQNGPLELTSDVTWYARPGDAARYPGQGDYSDDKNKCAYTNAGVLQTGVTYVDDLGPVIVKNMLEQSDNRNTDALVRLFGFAAINDTIDNVIGMSRTHLYHRIGCPHDASPQPWRHNRLTLRDIAKLYEKVHNGSLLGTGSMRDTFWQYMGGGPIGDGALKNMILAEAQAAGLSASERTQFADNVVAYSKGGSYGLCPDGGGACNPPTWEIRTTGGIIYLPFKNAGGSLVPTPYVYGRFLDHWESSCTFDQVDNNTCAAWVTASNALTKLGVETFRKIVKDALATW